MRYPQKVNIFFFGSYLLLLMISENTTTIIQGIEMAIDFQKALINEGFYKYKFLLKI